MANLSTKVVDFENKVTLSQAKALLHCCFRTERETGNPQPVLILGQPGQGKTAIAEQFTREINQTLPPGQKEWLFVPLRLSQLDPTDLKGIPVQHVESDGHITCSFQPPRIFPLEGLPWTADGHPVVLFLDEMAQAVPTIQNLASNILDGRIGDYKIDRSRCYIFAASNREQDGSAVYRIPANVRNRLVQIVAETTFDEWEKWAVANNLNPYVIGFLIEHTSMFNHPPDEKVNVYPTPRTWHKVSDLMNVLGSEFFDEEPAKQSMIFSYLSGLVGPAAARKFHNHCKNVYKSFKVSDIAAGKEVRVPEDPEILYTLVLEMTNWTNKAVTKAIQEIRETRGPKGMGDVGKELSNFLSEKDLDAINNFYKYLIQKDVDAAFTALMNRYQSPECKRALRAACLRDKKFDAAKKGFLAIHKATAEGVTQNTRDTNGDDDG